MTERLESARSLRECAARLRRIASTETKLSSELLKIADDLEEDAARIERWFRDKPPHLANDQSVA